MDVNEIFIKVFKMIWPWVLAMLILDAVIQLIPLYYKRWKRSKKFDSTKEWHNDKELLQWLRDMKPSEFEYYIANLFSKLDYSVEKVGGSHDGGIDVIAKKDGKTHFIQCKKFITSKVEVHDVRDFYGALADKLADAKGIFVTTNIFTIEAEQFAKDKPIELIDGNELIKLIKQTNPSDEQELKDKCLKCGDDLEKRNGKYGEFMGCKNYPKCKFTKKV